MHHKAIKTVFYGLLCFFVSIGYISCSLDPAPAKDTKAEISIQLPRFLSSAQRGQSLRAVAGSGGYIFLQLVRDGGQSVLLGPYTPDTQGTFRITDLEGGNYSRCIVFHSPVLPPSSQNLLLSSFDTAATLTEISKTIKFQLQDQETYLASLSIGLVQDVHLAPGTSTALSVTLVPITPLEVTILKPLALDSSLCDGSPFFVKVSGLVSLFASIPSGNQVRLSIGMVNTSGEPLQLSALRLFDEAGNFLQQQSLVEGESIAPQKNASAIFEWNGSNDYYLSISCLGSGGVLYLAPVIPETTTNGGAQTYRVTFDGNGGIVTASYTDVGAGDVLSLSSFQNAVIRPGYTLLGWDVSPAATSPAYSTGGVFGPITANVTLYAIWKDTTLPVITKVLINNDSPYTSDNRVSILVSIDADPSGISKATFNGTPPVDLSGATVMLETGAPVASTPAGSNAIYLTPSVNGQVTLIFSDVLLYGADGSNAISITVTDGAGNTSASLSDTIILDMTKPEITAVNGNSVSGSFTLSIIESNSGLFTLTYAKSNEYDTQYQTYSTLTYGTESSVTGEPWNIEPFTIVNVGKYDWIRVTATDRAGNATTKHIRRYYSIANVYASFSLEP